MNVADILKLRTAIDALLQSRRTELQSQLSQIGGAASAGRRGHKGKKVVAKYRHPKTGEEWSGRGGVAKWLAAEIKAGKKKESFLVK